MTQEPKIAVGIVDGAPSVLGRLNGFFRLDGHTRLEGPFSACPSGGEILLCSGDGTPVARGNALFLVGEAGSTFNLEGVAVGIRFHWQRSEDQRFAGNLTLRLRENGTIAVINEIFLEDYLGSVVASEMSGLAPLEFLKAHAVVARSWLTSTLERKAKPETPPPPPGDDEVIRWYGREEHDLYDVCADDHCQRYQGIAMSAGGRAAEAVLETRGIFLVFGNEICDARYSKACGGLTENFETAWEDISVPYLSCVSDAPVPHNPLKTEIEAEDWILGRPPAWCHVENEDILREVLPPSDQETKNFFRWEVTYNRWALEEILREKSGIDFGELIDLRPLSRGPSGRIRRLRIEGSRRSLVVGKELEIRRLLSKSHLLSSAFVVLTGGGSYGVPSRFILRGAGWGHGVGFCQIGAAVMGARGFPAEAILKHYFRGAEIKKLY